MTRVDWDDPDTRSIAVYLDGADDPDPAPDGTTLVDDDFLLLINAWWEPLNLSVPQTRPDQTWHAEIDTYEPPGDPEVEIRRKRHGDGRCRCPSRAARQFGQAC
jgi:glycogen operon protein